MSADSSQRPIRPGGSWRWSLALLFVAAAGLRLHGAWVAPPLSGFDGPYHAANIGIVLFEGRLPLPHEGWSSFHPPLYYAVCAAVWKLLPAGASPHAVLFALRCVGVACGLGLGLAICASARRLLPARPLATLAATALALFLPMHVGASFLLGNEVAGAALSATGVWLLLRWLGRPSLPGAAAVGAVFGLAVLAKFSAGVGFAAAGAALLARTRAGRPPAGGLLAPALVAGAAFLAVSGWYFARNVAHYGTPIVMQNEIVSREMRKQGYGPPRALDAYVSLRPAALLDAGDRSARATGAVWPVTFASIWFDYHGTVVDVRHPGTRALAWTLYAFGAAWTLLAALGAAAVLRRRDGFAVPLAGPALLLLLALALASYVAFTWRVATPSALKGSYLSPGLPAFALLAGWGFDRLAATGRRARLAASGALAGFAAAVGALFWIGWAPLPIDPASAYLLVYRDAPTERVFAFFSGRPTPDAASDPAQGRR